MKTMKKLMAVALTLAMVMSLFVTCFAAGETYSITVNNKNENVTISGCDFNAYKLFDLVYSGETTSGGHDQSPHAYYLSKTSDFYDGSVNSAGQFVPKDDGITGILAKYFDFTVLAGDDSKLLVTPKTATSGTNSGGSLFDEAAAYTMAEELTPYLEGMNPSASATANGESVTLDVTTAGAGYYLVDGQGKAKADNSFVTAAVALTSTDPQAVINAKVDAPTLDKTITSSNVLTSDGSLADVLSDGGKENLASIGDTVDYQVKGVVPNMTGYEKYFYVVTDTMSKGLTFNDDVAITLGDKPLAEDTDYTVTKTVTSDGTTIEIVFVNFIQYKGDLQSDGTYLGEYTGADIVITYSATVNDAAVIGNAGNPNSANLTFSNNPNQQPSGTPGNPDKPGPSDGNITGVTPDSSTKTYVAGVKLNKVNTDGDPLAGAQFKLEGSNLNSIVEVNNKIFVPDANGTWYLLKDGTYTESAPTNLNSDGYVTSGGSYIMNKQVTQNYTAAGAPNSDATFTVTTGSDGIITFTGLKQGEYTLTELAAPTGYNVLKDPIVFEISYETNGDGTFKNWTFDSDDVDVTDSTLANADAQAQLFVFDVVNNTGVELPSTGGIGTKIFYTMGAILVIGAMLVSKKRVGE